MESSRFHEKIWEEEKEMNPSEKIKRWCKDHSNMPENLFLKRLRKQFNDEQICNILDIIDDICPFCFDNEHRCLCMADD